MNQFDSVTSVTKRAFRVHCWLGLTIYRLRGPLDTLMPVPPRLMEWMQQAYPMPTVDPAWLDACLAWIAEELHLNDFDTQGDEIISNVDAQLLNSDLRDSMLAGTGFPLNIGSAENVRLRGHILVQIQGMTEIGHSAFSLQNVQQTRVDRADLAGLTGDDDEDEGPIPSYPRSMLQFELTDGSQLIKAIEYRRLPDLELGVTPLGYKVRKPSPSGWCLLSTITHAPIAD